MRRIVFKCTLDPGLDAQLDQNQLHYLFDVLRMKENDELIGLDQQGEAFFIQLGSKSAGTCKVLSSAGEPSREPDMAVTLFVPLLKGDKLDLVVQKSVELGVSEIVLFSARRSVVKWSNNLDKKLIRMQKIARDATQQCGRHKVPGVRGLLDIEQIARGQQGIFAWEGERNTSLREHLNLSTSSSLALLTGPEGGLTFEEVELLTAANWTPVTLGTRILRAETAAITLLACTMFFCGEMG